MLKLLLRAGLRRGLVGGSRSWMVVAAIVGGLRLLKRLFKSEPKVVLSEKLGPNDVFLIRHGGLWSEKPRRKEFGSPQGP
jgi:hypothetical protein